MKKLVKLVSVLSAISIAMTTFAFMAYAQDSQQTSSQQDVTGILSITKYPEQVTYTTVTSQTAEQMVNTDWNNSTLAGTPKIQVTKTTDSTSAFALTMQFPTLTGISYGLTPIESTSFAVSTGEAVGTTSSGQAHNPSNGAFVAGSDIYAPTSQSSFYFANPSTDNTGVPVTIMASVPGDVLVGQFEFYNSGSGFMTTTATIPANIADDTYIGNITFTLS